MKCNVIAVDNFRREAKRLLKKYDSLRSELYELSESLSYEPRQGTALGNDIFKIRLAVKSKRKGKSGGVRVITRVMEVHLRVEGRKRETDIYLLSIYDKSDQENISDKRIKEILDDIFKR